MRYLFKSSPKAEKQTKYSSFAIAEILKMSIPDEYKGDLSKTSEGIILYPKVDQDVYISETLENHKITIATLNLKQKWQTIHKELIALIS